jgi:hypothetical protein
LRVVRERERELVLRLAAVRGLAELVDRVAVERFAAGLRAADDFVAPVLADFERVDFFAVERFAAGLRAVERFAVLLRAGFAELFDALLEAVVMLSIDHLPDMTRCAASATASAMIDPSFVALETTLLAARSAVSAASRPASRIFLRAAGLALIAAAAAASPAASISLLIAALASLSTVLLLLLLDRDADEPVLDLEELEREELLRADFAIFYLPPSPQKTL